ncbi:MAG TPA: energy transducer TonB [bacterium]
MLRKNLLKISLALSLLLHLLFMLSYSWMHVITFANPSPEQKTEEKRLEFELVETPENARSDAPPDKANLLSDKNALAQDEHQKNDKLAGVPYSEGDLDVKNLPKVSVEPTPSPATSQASNKDFSNREERAESVENNYEQSYQKFSRQKLLKPNPQSNRNQQQWEIERPLYANRAFSAEDLGGFSFNTYAWDFAPYMLEMKRKVERNIFPPPAFTYMGLISGETIVRFKVMPNGEVTDLKVLNYTGHESLKETSVKAIFNSSRFRELPADFPEDFLEVTAKFTYYVTRR